MKTSPAMLGTGKWCCVLFLIPHLGIWSIYGEKSCEAQPYVKRKSVPVSTGDPFRLECPIAYCANKPNVTWCKLKGKSCSHPEDGHRIHTSWEDNTMNNISVYILHFDQALASDNGSYRCSVIVPSGLYESYSITVYVTERTQNNSEHPLINTTSASELPLKENMGDVQWILYSLLPLGGLPLLMTSFYLFCCLRRHQGKHKKPSDPEGREINLVDAPQPFQSQQNEVDSSQNSQTLPSSTIIYNNDPRLGAQGEYGASSNPCFEENKQGIVYASLNHSIIRMNPRQARNVEEAPTEYAAVCVRR